MWLILIKSCSPFFCFINCSSKPWVQSYHSQQLDTRWVLPPKGSCFIATVTSQGITVLWTSFTPSSLVRITRTELLLNFLPCTRVSVKHPWLRIIVKVSAWTCQSFIQQSPCGPVKKVLFKFNINFYVYSYCTIAIHLKNYAIIFMWSNIILWSNIIYWEIMYFDIKKHW